MKNKKIVQAVAELINGCSEQPTFMEIKSGAQIGKKMEFYPLSCYVFGGQGNGF
ncbi:hypothetical protein WAE56_16250 [Iodobacter sp. LRB]|uniref:hypothetical protein n=1 Tax=Iodobacter sp. LRB TaxID=3127955 RepID=UPI00307E5AC8